MSSRKKKPAASKKPAAIGGGSPAELESLDSASASDETRHENLPVDDVDTGSRLETPDEAQEDDASHTARDEVVPAISHINELRPRDEREQETEPASEYAAEPEDEAVETIEEMPPSAAPATRAHLKRVLESLIFVSDTILSVTQLGRLVKAKQAEVRDLLAEIVLDYEGGGIELVEVAGGYQFRSAAASAPFVRDMVSQRPVRLTRAQLETLALIAYRQPITRPEIDDVRGVDSGSAIKVLLERDLVKILGRKDEAGRPLLYGTAPYFLEFFSMKTMQDLPTLREFTELNQEHRELFQRKTGEIPDLSSDAETQPMWVADGGENENGEPRVVADGGDENAEPLAGDEDVEEREALQSDEPVSEVQDVSEDDDSASESDEEAAEPSDVAATLADTGEHDEREADA